MSECCSRCIIRNPLEGNLSEETVLVPAWQQLGNPGRRHDPAEPRGDQLLPGCTAVCHPRSPRPTFGPAEPGWEQMGPDGVTPGTRGHRDEPVPMVPVPGCRACSARCCRRRLWGCRGFIARLCSPCFSPSAMPRASPYRPELLVLWGPWRALLCSPPPCPAYHHQQHCSVKP